MSSKSSWSSGSSSCCAIFLSPESSSGKKSLFFASFTDHSSGSFTYTILSMRRINMCSIYLPYVANTIEFHFHILRYCPPNITHIVTHRYINLQYTISPSNCAPDASGQASQLKRCITSCQRRASLSIHFYFHFWYMY